MENGKSTKLEIVAEDVDKLPQDIFMKTPELMKPELKAGTTQNLLDLLNEDFLAHTTYKTPKGNELAGGVHGAIDFTSHGIPGKKTLNPYPKLKHQTNTKRAAPNLEEGYALRSASGQKKRRTSARFAPR